MKKIKFELSKKPSKQDKEVQEKFGLVPIRARWEKRTVKCLGGKMQNFSQEL
jgi:hypothetical protein